MQNGRPGRVDSLPGRTIEPGLTWRARRESADGPGMPQHAGMEMHFEDA